MSFRCPPWEGEDAPPAYTVPILVIENGKGKEAIMGTREIARRLEDLQPPASLMMDKSEEVRPALREAFVPIQRHIAARISRDVLRPLDAANADWFDRTRNHYHGLVLSEHIELDPQLATPNALKRSVQGFDRLLTMHPGTFVHGDEPSFTDFKIGAFLAWLMIGDKELFEAMLDAADPALRRLFEALHPYWPELPRNNSAFLDFLSETNVWLFHEPPQKSLMSASIAVSFDVESPKSAHPRLQTSISSNLSEGRALHLIHVLPKDFIVDIFQLEQLHSERRLVISNTSDTVAAGTLRVRGHRDLEAPSYLLEDKTTVILLELPRSESVLVDIPVHVRYQAPQPLPLQPTAVKLEIDGPFIVETCQHSQGSIARFEHLTQDAFDMFTDSDHIVQIVQGDAKAVFGLSGSKADLIWVEPISMAIVWLATVLLLLQAWRLR